MLSATDGGMLKWNGHLVSVEVFNTWAGCCWRHYVSAGVWEACCASFLLAWRKYNRGYYAAINHLDACKGKALGLRHSLIYNTDKKIVKATLTSSNEFLSWQLIGHGHTDTQKKKLTVDYFLLHSWRTITLIRQNKKALTILQTLHSWKTVCIIIYK